MNFWNCNFHNCGSVALGVGGAVGLRAIGWFVQLREPFLLFCPVHRPDGVTCQQLSEEEFYRFYPDLDFEQCPTCKADQEAKRIQCLMNENTNSPDDGERFSVCFICKGMIDHAGESATKFNDHHRWMHTTCCELFYRIHNHKVDNELIS